MTNTGPPLIYEDELPQDMGEEDYDRWYKQSRVVDGVRMGPPTNADRTSEEKTETLERTCMMCEEVRRVIAKVGPIEIKEPCPCKCGPGYFQPPGKTIRKAIREGK